VYNTHRYLVQHSTLYYKKVATSTPKTQKATAQYNIPHVRVIIWRPHKLMSRRQSYMSHRNNIIILCRRHILYIWYNNTIIYYFSQRALTRSVYHVRIVIIIIIICHDPRHFFIIEIFTTTVLIKHGLDLQGDIQPAARRGLWIFYICGPVWSVYLQSLSSF